VTVKRIRIVGSLVVGLYLVGIGALHGQDSEPSAIDPQPSIELPDDVARVLRDYERHWSAGSASELAALFVERGLIVRQGTWIRGREAIQQAYQTSGGPLRLRPVEYAVDGAVGYIVGAFGYGQDLPVEDRGLFVLTLQRDSTGRWLIVSDMDRPGG
jgi:ketosteroid isomerase-like protein